MEVKNRNRQRGAGGSTGEVVTKAAKNSEKKVEEPLTITLDELLASWPWMKDNEFIVSGYRPQSSSFYKSFYSLTYLHNETVNIYTHLLPALLLLLFGTYAIQVHILPRYPTTTASDLFAFACFFASAAICLGMSATFHTINNHSPAIATIGVKLDYLGIIILIMGSFISGVHYAFYCHRRLAYAYWSMISLLGAGGCATIFIVPNFHKPERRSFRTGVFLGVGLSGVLPAFHTLWIYGIRGTEERMGMRWFVMQGLLYVAGAGIYAARVPEKSAPGRYDLLGASHQIFHCLVVMAAGSHLVGLMKGFDYLHSRDMQVCG